MIAHDTPDDQPDVDLDQVYADALDRSEDNMTRVIESLPVPAGRKEPAAPAPEGDER